MDTLICADYAGDPWGIFTDACWVGATQGEKVALIGTISVFLSVVFVIVAGFLVMRK